MLQFTRMITTVDAHTAGEPLRIITAGYPVIKGGTMLEKRRYVGENHDHLRKLIMLEPRGHSGMYGCLVTAPAAPDGDFGVLFMHNEGYSTMCGHGKMKAEATLKNRSIIDTEFEARIHRFTKVGAYDALIPEISGSAQITGYHNFVLEQGDPLAEGFRITGG